MLAYKAPVCQKTSEAPTPKLSSHGLFKNRLHQTLLKQYLADTLMSIYQRCCSCRLRSADSRTLQLPSTRRNTLGDRAFSVAAVRAWNSLPPEIRNSDSLMND